MKRSGLLWHTSLIIVLILSLFFGVFTNIYISSKANKNLGESFEVLCENKGQEIDAVLNNISFRVDAVADAIISAFPDYEEFKGICNNKETEKSIKSYMERSLSQIEGLYSIYYRLSPELTNSYTSGFWIECSKGCFKDLEVTDLSKFEPSDLENVGWYYVPKNQKEPIWLEPYYNKNVYVFMVSYVVPLFIDGNFLGVLGVDVEIKDISYMVQGIKIYKSGYACLLSKDGKELTSCPIENDVSCVQETYHLVNDMTLVLRAPKDEVYPVTKNFIFCMTIVFYLILFVFITAFFTRTFYKNKGSIKFNKHLTYFGIVKIIFISLFVLVVIGESVFVIYKSGILQKEPKSSVKANNCYFRTLKVAFDKDFSPYTYYEDGKICGHDIELMNEIANRLNMNVEYYPLSWVEAKNACISGRVDVVLALETLESEKIQGILRSNSYVSDEIIVVGKQDVKSVVNFRKYRIGSIEGMEQYDIYGITENAILYEDFSEVLDAVESGSIDYGVSRQSVATIYINRKNYSDLYKVYGLMESCLGIGVNQDEPELYKQINLILSSLESEGFIEELNNKWISVRDLRKPLGVIMKENPVFFFVCFIVQCLLIFSLFAVRMYIKIKSTENEKDEFKNLSQIDLLTGVLNRGYGEKLISSMISYGRSGAFLLLDIDHFKKINDTFGHIVGDQAITHISSILKEICKDSDVVLRLGGDEFVVFMPEIVAKEALVPIVARLFNKIEEVKIDEMGEKTITVSLGAAFYDGEKEETFDSLYRKSDRAAYSSKNVAGNTVTYAE